MQNHTKIENENTSMRQQKEKPNPKATWKIIRSRAPKVIKPFPGFWPDGMLRWADPEHIRSTEFEMLTILEALIALNRTGKYAAFFNFNAFVGSLMVEIYEGRGLALRKPIQQFDIDCRHYPLIEEKDEKPFYAQKFIDELILLVQ